MADVRSASPRPGVRWIGHEITKPSGGPYVTVLQLRRDDVPELGFPADADLFQLLWCPMGIEVLLHVVDGYVHELEVYRYDGLPFLELPDVHRFELTDSYELENRD